MSRDDTSDLGNVSEVGDASNAPNHTNKGSKP